MSTITLNCAYCAGPIELAREHIQGIDIKQDCTPHGSAVVRFRTVHVCKEADSPEWAADQLSKVDH